MSDDRRLYVVKIGGISHEMLLNDQDAARCGDRARLVRPVEKAAPAPKNKARSRVRNKG